MFINPFSALCTPAVKAVKVHQVFLLFFQITSSLSIFQQHSDNVTFTKNQEIGVYNANVTGDGA